MTTTNHLSLARLWRIHWPEIEPTVIRYQEPAILDRVLSAHHAARNTKPMEAAASRSVRLIAGPPAPHAQGYAEARHSSSHSQ